MLFAGHLFLSVSALLDREILSLSNLMKGLDFLIYFLRLDSENNLIILIGRLVPEEDMNKWKNIGEK